jgi:manganese transport protein
MAERQDKRLSLSEVHGTVEIVQTGHVIRRILSVSGPAFLVAVGYMDPGNWATDIAAGSQFNYTLIWVLLMSNLMAVLLQSLSFRLGIVRQLDLAQANRAEYPRPVNLALYVLGEIAITATDLAEVLGSAIALQLLFGLPLVWGVLLTATDTFALLFLTQFGIRKMEAVILGLITIIGGGLLLEILFSKPDWGGVVRGFVPNLPNTTALYIAIGMLGATVMPHNLYLHSSLVQTRKIGPTPAAKRQAIRLNTVESVLALNMAFLVNAAILIASASAFFRAGHREVAEIQEAHRLLEPILGTAIAPIAFAVALLAAGQSSTITGTLAGQIVMEGYLNIRIPPWIRRLITRLLAIIPALIVILKFGENSTGGLLVLSQVVLSLQLPFAVIPLIHFVSHRGQMGEFAIGRVVKGLAWIIAGIIVALNVKLVVDVVGGWLDGTTALWPKLTVLPVAGAVVLLMGYIVAKPWLPRLLARAPAAEVGIHVPVAPTVPALSREEIAMPYRRVAVALDFSGRQPETLRETLRILGRERPRLALLHVVESATARFLGPDAADLESQRDQERLARLADELKGLGFEVETHIGTGKVVPELSRLINEFAADLVVVSAHGHRFFSDLLFGSTVDRLRHRIKATVLVVGTGG